MAEVLVGADELIRDCSPEAQAVMGAHELVSGISPADVFIPQKGCPGADITFNLPTAEYRNINWREAGRLATTLRGAIVEACGSCGYCKDPQGRANEVLTDMVASTRRLGRGGKLYMLGTALVDATQTETSTR